MSNAMNFKEDNGYKNKVNDHNDDVDDNISNDMYGNDDGTSNDNHSGSMEDCGYDQDNIEPSRKSNDMHTYSDKNESLNLDLTKTHSKKINLNFQQSEPKIKNKKVITYGDSIFIKNNHTMEICDVINLLPI